jgi:hypothetical protein
MLLFACSRYFYPENEISSFLRNIDILPPGYIGLHSKKSTLFIVLTRLWEMYYALWYWQTDR